MNAGTSEIFRRGVEPNPPLAKGDGDFATVVLCWSELRSQDFAPDLVTALIAHIGRASLGEAINYPILI